MWFHPSVGREAGVRRAGALVAHRAEEQECKLKWECKWENLCELDWMRRSEWGQEAEAEKAWFLGGEIAKKAEEVGEVAKRILFQRHVLH